MSLQLAALQRHFIRTYTRTNNHSLCAHVTSTPCRVSPFSTAARPLRVPTSAVAVAEDIPPVYAATENLASHQPATHKPVEHHHSHGHNHNINQYNPKLSSIRPIFLPNPSSPAYKIASRVLPSIIAEQFAILHACIKVGNMNRAERIFKELWKTKTEEMRLFADVNLYNAFLDGLITAKPLSKIPELKNWFDTMKERHNIQPDANTYAILVKGYMRVNSVHTTKAILQSMQQEQKFTMQEMINSSYLAESDINMLRALVNEDMMTKDHDVKKMLMELDDAAKDILGLVEQEKAKEVAAELVPEAKATSAVGVKFLRDQLDMLKVSKHGGLVDRYELQLRLEERAYEVALERLTYEREATIARGDKLGSVNFSPLKRIMWAWHEKFVPLIEEELRRCDKGMMEGDRRVYGPFLRLLPPEKLSVITILEIIRLHGTSGISDGMKTTRALIDVGKAVEAEYNAEELKKRTSHRAQQRTIHRMHVHGKLFDMTVRWQQTMIAEGRASADEKIPTNGFDWAPIWPSSIRVKVGSILTSLLIESAKIPVPSSDPATGEKITEEIPAFFHTYQYVYGKRLGIIKCSSFLTELLAREPVRDTLHPRLLPMLVHPRPWLTWNSGGFLATRSICMRIKDSPEQLAYLRMASEQDRLASVLTGLDVLGSTKWSVNKNIFNVVLKAWNSGEAIADIPPEAGEVKPLPDKPENFDTDPKVKARWVHAVKEIQNAAKNSHSLRCDVNYKVETARAFLDQPMFFPHNMDFRGRAYPIPPHLNHLGNDLCRGLLQFEITKPLGERGLRWMKIHIANLYGFDKGSFLEREQFATENMENIHDSVDNPLGGKRWWLGAEDPWQCLATCFEISAAYRSGKPEEYESRLPVHQDGTCNGLQHYAALGGDLAGAQAVNLAPSDRPADVYTGVADRVSKLIEQDAEIGVHEAKLLLGKVGRKIVKQTVMTNVYGVTFIGAKTQIENRLKERDDIPPDQNYRLSLYLAKQVFASLGEMFHGARQIQDWLNDSAKRIAKSVPAETLEASTENNGEAVSTTSQSSSKTKTFSARNPTANQMTSVIWTTPLGLPIVQPYRRVKKRQVSTILQTVFIENPDASCPVDAQKQSTAFPPNFIHSLDATHMLMSAVACQQHGLTFASVHDSYWTHACDVDTMNQILRDQFIELHSQPIIENLRNEFIERYAGYKIPVSNAIGDKASTAGSAAKAKQVGFAPEGIAEGDEDKVSLDTLMGPAEGVLSDEEDEDVVKAPPKKRLSKSRIEYTWEDLEFLPLPPKGEFDIRQVKDSHYFFH